MTINGEIVRAARGMLGLQQKEIAELAGVHPKAVARLEMGELAHVSTEVTNKIIRALEDKGLEFTPATVSYGAGVRWKSSAGNPNAVQSLGNK